MISARQTLMNAARGRQSYVRAHLKVARALLTNPDRSVPPDNRFLQDELFKINNEEWAVLAFDKPDWKVLDEIRRRHEEGLDLFYLRLSVEFIIANARRVSLMYEKHLQVSQAVFDDDADRLREIIESFSAADSQSLFAFRLVGATNRISTDSLVDYFSNVLRTDWLKKRFMYPFVYFAVNVPSDQYIERFLSYVITGQEETSERAVIRFLLKDDLSLDESLAFKAYTALLCHPFDACEILTNHFELTFAANGSLPEWQLSLVQQLSEKVRSARLQSLANVLTRTALPWVSGPTGTSLERNYGLRREVADSFAALLTPKSYEPPANLPKTRPFAELARLRMSKYPDVGDWNWIREVSRQWNFIDAGRLMDAIMTTLYMYPRQSESYETRQSLRLAMYFGCISSVIIAGPCGDKLATRSLINITETSDVLAACGEHIRPSGEYGDRLWITSAQWSLRAPQEEMRLSEWMGRVREQIRVAPSYLSGIDWAWVDGVISQVRLRPFRGNAAGVHALLLRQVEEPDRDPTPLRTAFEPLVSGMSLSQCVDWLITEFGEEATAFARYLLTPEIILLLGLAANETAALAGRVAALEACVRANGFGRLLTFELFEKESVALTSTLLLKKVNDGQFEIPWGMFQRDVLMKEEDQFASYKALMLQPDVQTLLTTARISTPHKFRNGRVENYTFPNNLWPIAYLILAIIEDFHQHPSFGLEVLLSTRFRHDTLRRELMQAVSEAKRVGIGGVNTQTQAELIARLSSTLATEVDGWLDRRMHSRRPAKPDGLFDLTPTQRELAELVSLLKTKIAFDPIIEHVIDWLKRHLEEQLPTAQATFRAELGTLIRAGVAKHRSALVELNDFRASDISRVASALEAGLLRRIEELSEWFRPAPVEGREPLTFGEVTLAADCLFEGTANRPLFVSRLASSAISVRSLDADKVRLCFDLLSEIFGNAQKHSSHAPARVRIASIKGKGFSGCMFSNLALPIANPYARSIAGERYTSPTDAIFREGNSGLSKIAALAATLIGAKCEVRVYRRASSFHLCVPIWADS